MLDSLKETLSDPTALVFFYMLVFTVVASLVLMILEKTAKHLKREDDDRLNELASVRGVSEYEIFELAASIWRIDRGKIDEDFKRFLQLGDIPHYVRDYVRRELKKNPSDNADGHL